MWWSIKIWQNVVFPKILFNFIPKHHLNHSTPRHYAQSLPPTCVVNFWVVYKFELKLLWTFKKSFHCHTFALFYILTWYQIEDTHYKDVVWSYFRLIIKTLISALKNELQNRSEHFHIHPFKGNKKFTDIVRKYFKDLEMNELMLWSTGH